MWEPSFIFAPFGQAQRGGSLPAAPGPVKRRPLGANALGQAGVSSYPLLGQANDPRMTTPSNKTPRTDPVRNPEVFDDVVVGIFRSTEEGRYVYANHRLAELYGYNSPAQMIEAIGDIEGQLYVESKQRDLFLKLIQQQGRIEQFESEIFRRDGSRIWISETARTVRNAAGKVLYYEGTVQDIGEQKVAELELRRSEILFHSLVENLPQYIFRKDAAGKFTFANKRFCGELGRTRREIIGKTDLDFFPADLAKKYREDDIGIMESGESLDTVEEHVTPEGEKSWVHVVKTPIHDEAGRCTGVQGIFWDVTQQRRTEIALAHERDLLRTLLDNIPDRIYFKDRDSRFLMISRAVAKDFGLDDPGGAVGKKDADFFSEEHARFALEDEQAILETGQGIIGKTEKETWNDGREGWVLTTKMPMRNADGEIVGTFGISKDISPLKKAEAELAQARDAALESAKVKSEFLANTSHEIRTPMNAIMGMTGLLLETPLNEQQRDFLTTIRQSADALLGVINDILDFSKIEARKLEIEVTPFDLRETVESAVDLLAEQARGKGLHLACVVFEDVWTSVIGDPGRLRQIVTNLVGNAIKFTVQGEVTVRLSSVAETGREVTIRCEIVDTGTGISADSQKRLFQPFTQGDGSLSRRYGGTGLGLTISKQLTEIMGGRIGLESKLGQGSSFWFELSLRKQLQPGVAEEQRQMLAGLKVLVVADDDTSLQVLRHQLGSRRIKTTEAREAAGALQLLQEAVATDLPFQVVILDSEMPEEDSLGLARAIKNDLLFAELKLILLTPMGNVPPPDSWQGAGIDDCLTKPVKQSRLLDGITRLLGGEAASGDRPSAGQPAKGEAKPLRILVAEDNRVNRKVLMLQLGNLGYAADAVANGLEALEAIRKTPYDVVLMDCHMPEMNGSEATRAIRKLPGRARQTRILAVTANADPDEKRKCLDAGMDDYLIKPIDLGQLGQTLGGIAGEVGAARGEAGPGDADSIAEGLRSFGDAAVVAELIDLFLQDAPARLAQAREALATGDAAEVGEAAHSLKGSARNLRAGQLAKVCEAVEKMGKTGLLDDAQTLLGQAEAELQKVTTLLEQQKKELGQAG
ncbi:MAG: PAS domain S-box protein [Verrucomicrobiota bacterium]|nr:PAS domain S-box protein [Verrucomicrobiota bacterium]